MKKLNTRVCCQINIGPFETKVLSSNYISAETHKFNLKTVNQFFVTISRFQC